MTIDVLQGFGSPVEEAIDDQCQMEQSIYTQQHNDFNSLKMDLVGKMTEYRRRELGIFDRQCPQGEYEEEIDLIAAILAYTELSRKRFGDSLPMRMRYTFLTPLPEAIEKALRERFLEDGSNGQT
jgi:hypothetical protein